MAPMINRVKVIATNNFAFEVKAMHGLERTHLESQVAKIVLTGPHDC